MHCDTGYGNKSLGLVFFYFCLIFSSSLLRYPEQHNRVSFITSKIIFDTNRQKVREKLSFKAGGLSLKCGCRCNPVFFLSSTLACILSLLPFLLLSVAGASSPSAFSCRFLPFFTNIYLILCVLLSAFLRIPCNLTNYLGVGAGWSK